MKNPLVILLALSAGLFAAIVGAYPDRGDDPIDTILVSLSSQWRQAPPEVGYKEDSAYATLALLQRDGRFLMMDCLLRRRDDRIAISAGDGQNIYLGEWSQHSQGNVVHVVYCLYWRSVARVPKEQLPGPRVSIVGTLGPRSLRLGDREFHVTDSISRERFDSFIGLAEQGS